MALDIYLIFNGNCREVVEFYSEVFKTKIEQLSTFGESPQQPNFQLPEEAKDLIMHARLNINGSTVMFSDTIPDQPVIQGNNFSLTLISDNEDELKTWYEKLKKGGSVDMELQETFWTKLYGNLTDKFGVNWQVSYDG